MDKMYQSDFNVRQVKPYYFNSQDTNFKRNSDTDIDATLNIFMSEEIPIAPMNSVFITEIIKQGDPRAMKFEEAKRKEIQGLIDRGTWKLVLKEDVPDLSYKL
jgi:hypothetical protein